MNEYDTSLSLSLHNPAITKYQSYHLSAAVATNHQPPTVNLKPSTANRQPPTAKKRYKSMLHCAKTMVREEGVLSLWKGLGARCARVVPGQGIIFCSYESINNWLRKNWL